MSQNLVPRAGLSKTFSSRKRSLRLIVTEKASSEGKKLVFMVEGSSDLEGFGSFEPFESLPFRQKPNEYFEGIYRDAESLNGADHDEILASYGAALYEELVPESLRFRFWRIRNQIDALHIVSFESWIPWEIMKLTAPDGSSVDPYFLAERFALTRWLSSARHPPAEGIALRRIAVVIPEDSGLEWSRQERQSVKALGSGSHIVVEIQPPRFSQVVDALGAGEYDTWHFSGHGGAWNGDPDRWSIELEAGEALRADHLYHRARGLGDARPLVFVNACSSASSETWLTCIGGLVAGFLRQGAGAYIGTHWAVPDRLAEFFARELYHLYLQGGVTLGEAVRRVRLRTRAEFPDETAWLAYTVFAHPQANCGELIPTAELKDPTDSEDQPGTSRGVMDPDSGATAPEDARSVETSERRRLDGTFASRIPSVGGSGRRSVADLLRARMSWVVVVGIPVALSFVGPVRDLPNRLASWQRSESPQDARALNNAGVELLAEGRLNEAARSFESALEIDAGLVEAIANRAEVDALRGDIQLAIEGYRRAAAVRPDSPIFRFNLGSLLSKQGRFQEAWVELEQSIALRSDYIEAYNELGAVFLQLERFEDARRVLEAGLGIDTDFAPLRKNLAWALIEEGAAKMALPHLEASLRHYSDPLDRMETTWLMARAYDEQGMRNEVCRTLESYRRNVGSPYSPWSQEVEQLSVEHACKPSEDRQPTVEEG